MAFREAKVYSDGSHYIAIPQKVKQPQKKKNVIYSIEQEERKEEFEKAYKENNEKNDACPNRKCTFFTRSKLRQTDAGNRKQRCC